MSKVGRLFAASVLAFGTLWFGEAAYAAQVMDVNITCEKDGVQETNNVGWDNENSFFEGKGDIARLYCEGGFSSLGDGATYVSDDLSDESLRYYGGMPTETEIVVEPEPEPSDTPTESETVSPEVEPSPEPEPEPSPEPSPEPTPEETPEPTPEPETQPTPQPEPSPADQTESPSASDQTESESPSISPEPEQPVEELPSEPSPSPEPSDPTEPETTNPTPVIPEPEPLPQPSPTPSPEPEPEPEPSPAPEEEPVVAPPTEEPQPQPETSDDPEPVQTPEPQPSPKDEVEVVPEKTADPEPVIEEPVSPVEPISEPVTPISIPEIEPQEAIADILEVGEVSVEQAEELVEMANEVLAIAEKGSEEYEAALDALALAATADDIELDEEIAAIPVVGAIAQGLVDIVNFADNVGADMAPETRETAEETVVAAVIVGQVAQVATSVSVSGGAYRRRIK